jgi:hypothetical protein
MNVLAAGVPTEIAASRCSIKQGWMPLPVWHLHRLGGSLLCVGACFFIVMLVSAF